jgi:DHA2 family multidrug resistance protein
MSEHGPARAMGDPAAYMRGFMLFGTIFVLALANFMAILDMTIVNVAVPHIAGSLAVSPNEGTWVITSYAVAEAITVPLTGWLAGRFGAVRVFFVAASGFAFFSMLCGFSDSLSMLIVFRILQGLSGGPLMPMSQTLIMRITPPKHMQMGLGLWTMTTVLAPIAGPLLGGYIADSAGWPWAFFINVPIGIFVVVMVSALLAGRETPLEEKPVDYVGLALLIIWVGALQMMLDNGQDKDWFASPMIIGLCVTSIIGFFAFLIWELTDEHPIVDLKVFRHRGFAVASLSLALTFGSFFAAVVLIPLWLQTNMGYTAAMAGYVTAYNGALSLLIAPLVAFLATRVDPRGLISFGLLVLASTVLVRVTFAQNMDTAQLILPQLIQGIGMPFFMIPLIGLIMEFVTPEETASAAGLINFLRSISGAFGTALVTTAWSNASISAHVNLSGILVQPEAVLARMRAFGLSARQALEMLNNMVTSQGVMIGTNNVFFTVGLVIVVAAASIWLAPKPPGPIHLGTAH